MRILKIFVILLMPALGFVACRKSDIKPVNPASTPAAAVAAPENANTNTTEEVYTEETNSRVGDNGETVLEEEGNITGVVASGDEDRDGGDKKHKKIAR
jgi:hypothetical protein